MLDPPHSLGPWPDDDPNAFGSDVVLSLAATERRAPCLKWLGKDGVFGIRLTKRREANHIIYFQKNA